MIVLGLIGLALSDLPIHATLDEVAGRWLFELVPISQNGFYAANETLPSAVIASCGSSVPNKNKDNLDHRVQVRKDQTHYSSETLFSLVVTRAEANIRIEF